MDNNLTGPEKAAVLLMSLGKDVAAQVLRELDDHEIQTVSNHMSVLGNVDLEVMEAVDKEFWEVMESGAGGLSISGLEYLKSTLGKALEPHKVEEILSHIIAPGEGLGGGLETIKQLDPKNVAAFVIDEHPQTAAIILAHLDPSVSGEVIQMLPEENRLEILHRLATLERVTPDVIRELDEVLKEVLKYSASISGNRLGGVFTAAKVMGFLDRATEVSLLTALDEKDPDLAEEIRHFRFTFEDIIKVDDNGIQAALKEIDQKDLLVSMKTATDELKEKIFSNMSERAGAMLKEDLETLPPTKISDVDKAQKKIVAAFKKLEEEGKVIIGGDGEELV